MKPVDAPCAGLVGESRSENALTDFQRSLDLDRIYRKGALRAVPDATRRDSIRVLSWNIERGSEPARIAETLLELAPDVACLQEVEWNEGGRDDVLEYLARRTGMLGLFGIEFLEIASPLRPEKLAGGGASGNALLTRVAPATTWRIDLPSHLDWQRDAGNAALPWRVRRRIRRERRIGRRFGVCAELAFGERRIVVASTHLEDKLGGVGGRWSQYRALLQAIEAPRGATGVGIVAGDFNTFDCRLARLVTPDTDATALGKPGYLTEAQWWKAALLPQTGYADPFCCAEWTFHVPPLFRAKLDWITVKGATVRRRGVGAFASSDHRPIWIDVEWPGGPTAHA